MSIETRNVQFKVPEGYRDGTNYSFKSENGDESLEIDLNQTVQPLELDSPVTTEYLYRDKLAELENVRDDFGIEAIESGHVNLAGIPARSITWIVDEKGTKVFVRWIIVLIDKETDVLIAYTVKGSDTSTYNQIITSVVINGGEGKQKAAKGYIRRRVGRITLDVPERLKSQNTYKFYSLDGKVSLALSVYGPEEKRPAESLQDNIKKDSWNGMMKIVDAETKKIALNGGGGIQVSYLIDDSDHPYAPSVKASNRAEMTIGETWLYLHGTATLELRDQLNSVWNEFTSNISPIEVQ